MRHDSVGARSTGHGAGAASAGATMVNSPPIVVAIALNVSGAFPPLVTVTTCCALSKPIGCAGKSRTPVETYATAAGAGRPTPLRPAVCGLPGASSAMPTVPARVPAMSGANVTVMLQLPPAATEAPQLLTSV